MHSILSFIADYLGTIVFFIFLWSATGFVAFFSGRFGWELADRIIEGFEEIKLNRRMKETGIGK